MRYVTSIVLFCAFTAPFTLWAGPGVTARVVENPDRGAWDDTPNKTFHILENLTLGSEDGDDAFGRISSIAVDSRGRIIILDAGYVAVKVYDPEASTMQTFGREGDGPGEFRMSGALCVDDEDRIYVAGRNGRVAIFSPDGEFLDDFGVPYRQGGPTSVRVGSFGTYFSWPTEGQNEVVHHFDPKHKYVSSFSPSVAAVEDVQIDERGVRCGGIIDIAPDGTVLYAQWHPYEIRTFAPDGTPRLVVHRDNKFVKVPQIQRTSGGTSIRGFGGASAIIAIGNDLIMHVCLCLPDNDPLHHFTMVDLFDRDGHLLKSRRLDGLVMLKTIDDDHQLYAVESRDYPMVVRYDLRLP